MILVPMSVRHAQASAFDMKPLRFRLLLLITCAISCSMQGQTASQASKVRAHLSRGEAALRANNPTAAEGEFRDALAIDPRNAEANSNLGVLEYARGDYRHACENFREALTRQPSLIKAEALLGLCETKIGDQAAAKHLEDSFEKLQDAKLRTQVGLELVGMYYASGETERAVAVTQKLVDLNPEDPDLLYAAQRLYNELADATLNKLAIVAPNSARMQQVIAERLINAGDLDDAIMHYRKALELDPHLNGVHYELAQAVLESSRFDATKQATTKSEIEAAKNAEGNSASVECLL